MPFNGAGVYSPPGADFPAVTQTVISSTHYNNVINDIATALSTCLTKDGQQTATANIPFGGFRATNVGITAIAGSVGTPAINVSDAATGLYRSAASELAVTVAGTQRGRFDATGLIITGVVTASGIVTASQLIISTAVGKIIPGATSLSLRNNADSADNLLVSDTGAVTVRTTLTAVTSVVTPIVDSGTTGSLSLKTNNGQTGFRVDNRAAAAVNMLATTPFETGSGPLLGAVGSDANIDLLLTSAGNKAIRFFTGTSNSGGIGGLTEQVQIPHTASASRVLTLTGSNGGNPTIGVTAGNLAITPSVVIAGALLQIGTTPSLTGTIGLPNNTFIGFRNAANSSDFSLIRSSTINAITDIVQVGASAGVQLSSRSAAGAPTTSDITSGQWTVWRDTAGATTKLYYNNAGALQSVALT